MNRTAGDVKLFDDPADYAAFERVIVEAVEREPGIRLCSFCLMPNHFHFVLWPERDGLVSSFMQWLTMTHARRWRGFRQNRGRGHLYQGRFRSFVIQEDRHFLSVCRYVERNALRARLVKRAQDWQWCSLWARSNSGEGGEGVPLAKWPMDIPADWATRVNRPQSEEELSAIHASKDRGRPFGDPDWVNKTAAQLGIGSSLRRVGRPRKVPLG